MNSPPPSFIEPGETPLALFDLLTSGLVAWGIQKLTLFCSFLQFLHQLSELSACCLSLSPWLLLVPVSLCSSHIHSMALSMLSHTKFAENHTGSSDAWRTQCWTQQRKSDGEPLFQPLSVPNYLFCVLFHLYPASLTPSGLPRKLTK